MQRIFIKSIIFLFLSTPALAQTWEVGGSVGRSGYMGDLNQTAPYAFNNNAYGFQVKRNFDGYFSLKLNYWHGKMQAADSLSSNQHFKNRNLSFFSPLDELGLQLEFNFFKYIPSVSKKKLSPYLFTGLAGAVFNPQTKINGEIYELNQYGTEGQGVANRYKLFALSIPYGAGVKYNIKGKWSLIGEVGYRTALTDYLDDVSTTYPSFVRNPDSNAERVLLSDPSLGKIGVPGTQRGDFRKRDTYMFVGLSLTYTFISQKCPLF